MAAKVHRYRLEADYGPADLFAALKAVCSARPSDSPTEFEFDWMQRRVALTGPDRKRVEAAAEKLLDRVNREGGPGLLLAGKTRAKDGHWEVPIGVTLQTPDIYLEAMAQALTEQGLRGIRYDMDKAELEIPVGLPARALGYQGMVLQFPLPPYIRVTDLGMD